MHLPPAQEYPHRLPDRPDRSEPRYTVTQTSDAFEDPLALWDHQTDEYYRDAYGDIPTFTEEWEAAAYLEELTGAQPAHEAGGKGNSLMMLTSKSRLRKPCHITMSMNTVC